MDLLKNPAPYWRNWGPLGARLWTERRVILWGQFTYRTRFDPIWRLGFVLRVWFVRLSKYVHVRLGLKWTRTIWFTPLTNVIFPYLGVVFVTAEFLKAEWKSRKNRNIISIFMIKILSILWNCESLSWNHFLCVLIINHQIKRDQGQTNLFWESFS